MLQSSPSKTFFRTVNDSNNDIWCNALLLFLNFVVIIEVIWVVGERNKGDCNALCDAFSSGSTCDAASFAGLTMEKAKGIIIGGSTDVKQCEGWFKKDVAKSHFTQCSSSKCGKNVKNYCSFPSKLSSVKCKMSNGFGKNHARICPCKMTSDGRC